MKGFVPAALAAIGAISLCAPARAQDTASASDSARAAASTVCLVRSTKDFDDKLLAVRMRAPAAEEKTYQALGYQAEACGSTDISTYRKQACSLVAGNSAVHNRVKQVFGVLPEQLCSAAKLLDVARPTEVGIDKTAIDQSTPP